MFKISLPIRYLIKRPISYLAVGAVALCVFIVVVVMTVMNGLVQEFSDLNHGYVGDCVVVSDSLVGFAHYEKFMSELQKQPFIAAVTPVIKTFGLVGSDATRSSLGLEVVGIVPQMHQLVTNFENTLYYNKGDAKDVFVPPYDANLPGCVTGVDLMYRRMADGSYNYVPFASKLPITISCFALTPRGAVVQMGRSAAINTRTFYFCDTSNSGLARVDTDSIYLPLDAVQQMTAMSGENPRVSALLLKFSAGIKLDDGVQKTQAMWNNFVESEGQSELAFLFDSVRVQSWKSYRREVIAPMEKEQVMMAIAFIMVGFITVFIIFVIFYMIINQKSRDIGVLKSIGTSAGSLFAMFLGFACLIGLAGSAIGSLGAWALLENANRLERLLFDKFGWQVWDRSIYAIGEIPSDINPAVLSLIVCSAVLACFLGATVPVLRGVRRNCADVLRVNQL